MRTTPKNVLVIGAGMAGLAAAQYLAKQGLQVTVIEADSHIGGRTFTDHSLNVPLDMGAAWIHGTEGNPVADLAKQIQVNLKLTDFINFDQALLFDASGQIAQEDHALLDEKFTHLLEQAKQFALSAKQDMSLSKAIELCLAQNKQFVFPNDYLNWRLERLSGYMAADAYKLSARYWDQDQILPGGNYLLLDGYQSIITNLAFGLPIQLNTPIIKIKLTKNKIEAHSAQQVFQADALLCTVSLGVLKKELIKFEPNLPANKQSVIQELGMGLLNKIALKFPEQFWPENFDLISYFKNKYDNFLGFVNYAYYFNQPILVGYSGGDLAYEIEKMTDFETVEHAMHLLRHLFGQQIPQPIASKLTRWGKKPFSLGSYSYMQVGGTIKDYDTLAESVDNKLFFAGEATHHYFPATVHGAYLSGIREAQKILTLFA